MAKKKTAKAVKILHDHYIRDDPKRKTSLEEERLSAQVARTIYQMRVEAGLTQKQLADLIGTTQSVISRLEDADYETALASLRNFVATYPDDPQVPTTHLLLARAYQGLPLEWWLVEEAGAFLRPGENVLAVEVHNTSPTSSEESLMRGPGWALSSSRTRAGRSIEAAGPLPYMPR